MQDVEHDRDRRGLEESREGGIRSRGLRGRRGSDPRPAADFGRARTPTMRPDRSARISTVSQRADVQGRIRPIDCVVDPSSAELVIGFIVAWDLTSSRRSWGRSVADTIVRRRSVEGWNCRGDPAGRRRPDSTLSCGSRPARSPTSWPSRKKPQPNSREPEPASPIPPASEDRARAGSPAATPMVSSDRRPRPRGPTRR